MPASAPDTMAAVEKTMLSTAVWRSSLATSTRTQLALKLVRLAIVAVLFVYLPGHIIERFVIEGFDPGGGFDFNIFLRAADDVLNGHSPYPAQPHSFTSDANYVYPPLFAFLSTPLTAVPYSVAVGIFAAASIGALMLSLYLFGVRDWRCYSLVVVFPLTRDGFTLGTIGPFLLVTIALAWHFRDRLRVVSAASVGVGIILKLFLWPLVIWLAATRRVWAALLSVLLGALIALVCWAAIDFRGLTDYPALLRRLSHLESLKSYSVVALGHALGLPVSVAWAVAIAIGAALLIAVVRTGRDTKRPPRERDAVSLTYAVAAALVLSPILWSHYLVLIVVPIALARPRLSPLWFVPLIQSALSYAGWKAPGGWPRGDVAALAIILGIASLSFAGALWRPSVGQAGSWDVRRRFRAAATTL